MRRSYIVLSIIFLGIVLFFIVVNAVKPEPKNKVPTSTWTKAICNEENYCLDIQITCEENGVIDIKPTGEGSYFPKDWEDPRPVEIVEKWC